MGLPFVDESRDLRLAFAFIYRDCDWDLQTAAVLGDLDAVPLELLDAFGAELDEGIRERLRTDPDYDPEKFPAIAEYFKS